MPEVTHGGEERRGRMVRADVVQSAERYAAVAHRQEVWREADVGQAGAGGDAEGVGGEELAAGGEKPGGPVAFVCGVSALLGSRERFVVVVGGWGGGPGLPDAFIMPPRKTG